MKRAILYAGKDARVVIVFMSFAAFRYHFIPFVICLLFCFNKKETRDKRVTTGYHFHRHGSVMRKYTKKYRQTVGFSLVRL